MNRCKYANKDCQYTLCLGYSAVLGQLQEQQLCKKLKFGIGDMLV